MRKSILNLGNELDNSELKQINGGRPGHCTKYDCYNPNDYTWTCVPSPCHCPFESNCQ